MEKYYAYSVKDKLKQYFGEEALTEMRRKDGSWFDCDRKRYYDVLAWQYADERVLSLHVNEYFLLETVLCDDYVVYIMQKDARRYAFLAFMHYEHVQPFDLDTEYANDLLEKWRLKGYTAYILSISVGIEESNGSFRLVTHCTYDGDAVLLRLERVGKKYIFVKVNMPCWEVYDRKLLAAIHSGDEEAYRCFFDENIKVVQGAAPKSRFSDTREEKILAQGYAAVRNYFAATKLKTAYVRPKNSNLYELRVVSHNSIYNISVSYKNGICKIYEEELTAKYKVVYTTLPEYSLYTQTPRIHAVRALEKRSLHAYAIQVSFADDSVRNYYLATFNEIVPPESVQVENYCFDDAVLNSVQVARRDGIEGVLFSNGCFLPDYILYHRGLLQLYPEKRSGVVYQDAKLCVERLHRVPLRQDLWGGCLYYGSEADCFGYSSFLRDAQGMRVSDLSFYHKETKVFLRNISLVCVEPSRKYGYIRDDGTWLVPPVFDAAEMFAGNQSCAKGYLINGDEKKQVLITVDGEVVPFAYEIEVENFSDGLCPFCVERYDGKIDFPDENLAQLEPGLWGFVNAKGQIAVEPQYVYASAHYELDGGHAFVARLVDGQVRWGVLDRSGNEVIPCTYCNLSTRWGNILFFQEEKNGLYGLMDFDGKVVLEPKFRYIEEYNAAHRLITAGEDAGALGVYSLDKEEMLISPGYGCVDYEDGHIECETVYDCTLRYFDYEGNEIACPEYETEEQRKNRERGVRITGTWNRRGLSTLDGRQVLPEIYSTISVCDRLVVASCKNVADALFTLDGKCIVHGPCRRISVIDGRITVDTPFGTETYVVKLEEDAD